MRLWKSWALARKDMKILIRRKSLVGGLLVIPVLLGVGLPAILEYVIIKKVVQSSVVVDLLGAFAYFFVLLSVVLPLYISSYSIVGEKLEKSIEPLLATPTSDEEILLGKYIGVFIPVIIAIWLGTAIFMIMADAFSSASLGYYYYPNQNFGILVLIAVPLACLYAISFSVFVSAKVNSTQTAYQLGVLTAVPFFILYVLGELGIVSLVSDTNILIISAALLVMAVVMFFISRATFKREEILTSWK